MYRKGGTKSTMSAIYGINLVFCLAVLASGIANIIREYYFGGTNFRRFVAFNVIISIIKSVVDIDNAIIISIMYLIVGIVDLTLALISRSVAVEKQRNNEEDGG